MIEPVNNTQTSWASWSQWLSFELFFGGWNLVGIYWVVPPYPATATVRVLAVESLKENEWISYLVSQSTHWRCFQYILDVFSMQDASPHQDDIVSLVGDLDLNLHLPLESWEGRQPKENNFELVFHGPQLSVKLFEKTVKVNPWPLKSNIDTKNDHILKGTTLFQTIDARSWVHPKAFLPNFFGGVFSKPSFWVFLNFYFMVRNACN